MKSLVTYIATSLVDDPGAVRVRETAGARETRLDLRVSSQEVGRLIGREGRTIRALRTLLGVAGKKAGRKFTLEIQE